MVVVGVVLLPVWEIYPILVVMVVIITAHPEAVAVEPLGQTVLVGMRLMGFQGLMVGLVAAVRMGVVTVMPQQELMELMAALIV